MIHRFHGLVLQSSPLMVVKIGGMDPNGYGASSTYTMGMIWQNMGIMVKGEKFKSVFGETLFKAKISHHIQAYITLIHNHQRQVFGKRRPIRWCIIFYYYLYIMREVETVVPTPTTHLLISIYPLNYIITWWHLGGWVATSTSPP